jgi:DNA-directed RNA polymerase III subunit RPC1
LLQVSNQNLYEQNKREPIVHGCMDSRLGTSDKKRQCGTCHKPLADCIGHFGHIKLALPVFHVG